MGDITSDRESLCRNFASIDAYCKASLIRTANKTIKGWISHWHVLQQAAHDHLSLLSLANGALCTSWWDTKPFVFHLASAYYGLHAFSKYKPICENIQKLATDFSVGSNITQNKSIQAAAQKAIIAHNDGYNFYPLLHRRCSPLGLSSIAVISRTDVQQALSVASDVSHVVAMAWLKTITNAWCTSTRMHEAVSLPCIFGYKDCTDRLDHYVDCIILWSILHEAFGGRFSPCLVSRLNYSAPCPQKLIHIACAFEIYHALKIGLRSAVDEAVSTSRFSEIIRNASKIAKESTQQYIHFFPRGRLALSNVLDSNQATLATQIIDGSPAHLYTGA